MTPEHAYLVRAGERLAPLQVFRVIDRTRDGDVRCDVVARDPHQAIRLAGDEHNMADPGVMLLKHYDVVRDLNVSVAEALCLHDAPCVLGDHLPTLPRGTRVSANFLARDVGTMLAWLDRDAEVTVVGWWQNVNTVSRDVQLRLVCPFLPTAWNYATVTLEVEGDDRATFFTYEVQAAGVPEDRKKFTRWRRQKR